MTNRCVFVIFIYIHDKEGYKFCKNKWLYSIEERRREVSQMLAQSFTETDNGNELRSAS